MNNAAVGAGAGTGPREAGPCASLLLLLGGLLPNTFLEDPTFPAQGEASPRAGLTPVASVSRQVLLLCHQHLL